MTIEISKGGKQRKIKKEDLDWDGNFCKECQRNVKKIFSKRKDEQSVALSAIEKTRRDVLDTITMVRQSQESMVKRLETVAKDLKEYAKQISLKIAHGEENERAI